MRASINGIGVQTAASLFGFRDRFRKGVMSHVWLQSKLDRRYGGSDQNIRSSLKSAGLYYLAHSYYFDGDIYADEESLTKLKQVTLQDVKAVVEKYMKVENPVEVIVR